MPATPKKNLRCGRQSTIKTDEARNISSHNISCCDYIVLWLYRVVIIYRSCYVITYSHVKIYDYTRSYYLPVIIYYIYVTIYGPMHIVRCLDSGIYTPRPHRLSLSWHEQAEATGQEFILSRNSSLLRVFPVRPRITFMEHHIHLVHFSPNQSLGLIVFWIFRRADVVVCRFLWAIAGVFGSTQTTTSDSIKKRRTSKALLFFVL